MDNGRFPDNALDQLVRAYTVFGVRPDRVVDVVAAAPTGPLPDDWSFQVARAYAVFGVVPADGVDEFGLWGKLKAAARGAKRGWQEDWVRRAPEGSKIGGQFIEKPGAYIPKPETKVDLDSVNERISEAIENARREQERLRKIPPGMFVAAPANPGMPLPPKSDPVARARAYEEWAAAYDKFYEKATGKKPPQRNHGQLDGQRGAEYGQYMDGWMDMYRWWYEGNKHHWDKPEQERPTPEKPEEPAKPGPDDPPTPDPRPDKTETVEDPPEGPEPADSEKWVQDTLPGMEDTTPEPVEPEPTTPEPVEPEPTTPEPATPEPAEPEPAEPEPVTPEPVTPEPVTPEPAEPEPAKPEPKVKKREANRAEYDNDRRLETARVEYDEDGRGTLVDADGNPFEEVEEYDQFENVVRRVKDSDGKQVGWVVVEGPDLGKVKYTDRDQKPGDAEPPPVRPEPEPQRIDVTADPGPLTPPKNPRMVVTPEGDRAVVDEDGKAVPLGQGELDWAEQAELIYDENGEPAGWIPQDGSQSGYYFPLTQKEKNKLKKMFEDQENIQDMRDEEGDRRKEKEIRKNKRAMEREAFKQMFENWTENMMEKGKQRWAEAREKRRREAFDRGAAEWKKNFEPDEYGNGDTPGQRRNVVVQRGDPPRDLNLEVELDADMRPVPGSVTVARDSEGRLVGLADPNNNGEQYRFASYSPGDLSNHQHRVIRSKDGEPLGVIMQSGPKDGQFIPWNDAMATDDQQPKIPGNTPNKQNNGKIPNETIENIKKATETAAQAAATALTRAPDARVKAAGAVGLILTQLSKSKSYDEWVETIQNIDPKIAPYLLLGPMGQAIALNKANIVEWDTMKNIITEVFKNVFTGNK